MIKLILFLFTFISFCYVPSITFCSDNNYARIIDNHTYLYKTASDDNNIKNIICILENTYYVEILLIYDEDFYKVSYNGVSGFVLRNKVKKVSSTPLTPFPKDIKMMTINNNIYLRSTPEKSNNNLSIIPSNCTNLKYIGKAYGEQLDDFRQNLWYYVEYENVCGYVYSEYIVSVSDIYPNVEEISFLNTNDFDEVINPLSDTSCLALITIMLIPMLLVIFLIYKKPRKGKYKEKIVKIREFDDRL